ncbi:hypothetical protein RB623_10955 [Mesorhizobium sp. LHD-90]|uniref:hypothetical protein n=1 Tax=Mesorhizobium sp. LHD-90 TaxID=3071414 RepID=UPI0027E1F62E|nr:hypothetical protein [Mesorhizobium sp. LHD-90]MDQ6434565.1 hypothetical protein [Mesorhizobium sp. LHD-90]
MVRFRRLGAGVCGRDVQRLIGEVDEVEPHASRVEAALRDESQPSATASLMPSGALSAGTIFIDISFPFFCLTLKTE